MGSSMKSVRRRFRYWVKKKGIDKETAIIIATSPKYVLKEFKEVQKLKGTRQAVRFLKAKFGRR